MKIEDFKIIIIKNSDSGTFTAFPESRTLSGLIVQVNKIEDIPKEISKLFSAMINHSFDTNNFEIVDFENES